MKLSKRLSILKSFYKDSHSIWDIGCDHGQLGLSFLSENKVEVIHLVDPAKPVIETLKNTVKDSYITEAAKIKIIFKKGQEITLNPESKTVFIAGMGGGEIQEILEFLMPQLSPKDRVVISPHRKILEIRNYLSNSAFRLLGEVSLQEGRQFYQVMALTLDPAFEKVSVYGSNVWAGEVGQRYLNQQLEQFSCHKDVASEKFVEYLKRLNN